MMPVTHLLFSHVYRLSPEFEFLPEVFWSVVLEFAFQEVTKHTLQLRKNAGEKEREREKGGEEQRCRGVGKGVVGRDERKRGKVKERNIRTKKKRRKGKGKEGEERQEKEEGERVRERDKGEKEEGERVREKRRKGKRERGRGEMRNKRGRNPHLFSSSVSNSALRMISLIG